MYGIDPEKSGSPRLYIPYIIIYFCVGIFLDPSKKGGFFLRKSQVRKDDKMIVWKRFTDRDQSLFGFGSFEIFFGWSFCFFFVGGI